MAIDFNNYTIHIKKSGQKLKKFKCTCDSCGFDRGFLPKAKANKICRLCKVKQPEYRAKLAQTIRAIRSTEESRAKTRKQIRKQKDQGWKPAFIDAPITLERRIAHSCGLRNIPIDKFDGFQYESIDHKITQNFRKAIRKCKQSRVTVKTNIFLLEKLGYSFNDLKKRIESQFKEGMTWDNYGKWHIDHIIPLKFKNEDNSYYWPQDRLRDPDSYEFKKAWGLDNLQPMWAQENIKKNNRFIG